MPTGTPGEGSVGPESTVAVGGGAPAIEVKLPDAEGTGAPGTAEAAAEAGPLDAGVPAFGAAEGEGTPAVVAAEEDIGIPSRFAGLKAGWNSLRARVGGGLSGLRERAGNISNPITGPRVKTAAKVGAVLALLAGAGYGVKKGFDYITDGAEVTPAPVVEPVPVTPTTQWTPRSTGLDTNNDGSISKEECAGPLAKSGGKTVYVYNCETGAGSYCTFGADPKLDTTVERSFTETAFNNYEGVKLPKCTTDYQETTLVSK